MDKRSLKTTLIHTLFHTLRKKGDPCFVNTFTSSSSSYDSDGRKNIQKP